MASFVCPIPADGNQARAVALSPKGNKSDNHAQDVPSDAHCSCTARLWHVFC
jgi:hypothetical protein